jgi:acetyl-CoA acetyltransferase
VKRNNYPHVVIAGAARTPVGLKCGTLGNFSTEDLGVLAVEEAIRRSGVARAHIDATIGANVYQCTAPGTQDIYFPRNVDLRRHLDTETPGLPTRYEIMSHGVAGVEKELSLDREITNLNGRAVAIGHPPGSNPRAIARRSDARDGAARGALRMRVGVHRWGPRCAGNHSRHREDAGVRQRGGGATHM